MTHTEAIELIRSTPLYRHDKENGRQSDLFKALDLAIEAIKKQIPTTPMDILYQKKFDIEVGICSSCGNIVNSEYEWCDGCGQHLDWSK